jgi:hypothetical protein
VDDDVGTLEGHQRRELLGGGVEGVDREVAAERTRIGKVGQRSRREVVDHVDGVTLGQQSLDEVRTDEPGPTDDE